MGGKYKSDKILFSIEYINRQRIKLKIQESVYHSIILT